MLGSAQKAGQCRAGPPVIDSVEQSVKAFDRVNNTGCYGGGHSLCECVSVQTTVLQMNASQQRVDSDCCGTLMFILTYEQL